MRTGILLASGAALLAACATTSSPSTDIFYVREGMVNAINPATEAIWNLQVEVMDDYGNFDPALMDEATWTTLTDSAHQLRAAAQLQANAGVYVATAPESALPPVPEGTDLAAVQTRLEANPQAYGAYAAALTDHSNQLVDAVNARDTAELTRLVNDLQPVCKACHDAFWYPEEYEGG